MLYEQNGLGAENLKAKIPVDKRVPTPPPLIEINLDYIESSIVCISMALPNNLATHLKLVVLFPKVANFVRSCAMFAVVPRFTLRYFEYVTLVPTAKV
jgi:hypothetical protein